MLCISIILLNEFGQPNYDGEDSIMEGGDGSKSGLEKVKDKCKHTRDERKKHKKKPKKS